MTDKKRRLTHRHLLLAATALLILVRVTTGAAQIARDGSTTRQFRVLVKVRATLAQDFEAALPLSNLTLAPGQDGSARVQAFMTRHAPRTVTPLYPDIVRRRKAGGLTDRQVADDTRQRFANRARRLRAAFQPPDISRTYALDMGTGSSRNLEQILRNLRADPDVEFAEEDKVVSVNMTPNDPFFSTAGSWGQGYDDLWGMKKIGGPAAWDTGAGAGVVVAVVDTGIDYTHPDIAANVWTNAGEIPGNGIDDDGNGYVDDVRGWDSVGQSNDPIDHHGHGTHVAGTIAAIGNNGIGVIGVAWQARVMIVKGLDDSGNGFDSTLANAILYAANNGADVINASWGGFGTSQAITDAVNYAYNLGTVVVAAAGNNAVDAHTFYPANLEQAITVAAATPDDAIADFSNFGSKIDVAAPGTDILSLRAAGTSLGIPVDNDYTRAYGTSMAAPHVSGVAALVLSRHPGYSNEDVRQAVRTSAADFGEPGYDLNFGYGGLNAAGAIAANTVLEAKIKSPLDQASVADLTTISGVARGSGFAYYTLEYGAGTLPTVWTAIQTSSTPTTGALGVFDATSVPNGAYAIRLTTYNTSGQAFVDRIQLLVHSFFISSPTPPRAPTSATTFKPGVTIPIIGSAGGTTFQSFQVDWAAGIDPGAGWQTTGITLTGGGLSPVSNGSLAAWDTSSLTAAAASYYTIRLRLTRAGSTAEELTIVYLEPDLLSANWPQWLDQGPYFNSGTVPATNADGSLRLLVASPNVGEAAGLLWTLTPQGAPVKTLLPGLGSFHQPSAANLDGTGGDEAVVSDTAGLHVFHEDNSSTIFTPGLSVDFMKNQDVIEDLDGDSRWETLALGNDYGNNVAYIYAWRPDGQLLNGNFPIQIADQNDVRFWYNRVRFVVGSLDGDGKKAIVALEGLTSSTYTLRLFGNDGSPRTWNTPVLDGVPFAMAAADLDHNGKLETIIDSYSGTQATLHVFQPDGSERPGWPVILPNQDPTGQSFLAVGDLNRDGREEIFLSRGTDLYVFKADGTLYSSAWPLQTSALGYGAVVLGDIDGDGFPEIVTTRSDVGSTSDPLFPYSSYYDNKLLAIRRDGTIARSWQLTGKNGFDLYAYPMPAIGDFNQDGITDISVAYEVTGPGDFIPGVVTILSTGATFNPAANDWPLLHLNPRNTSTLVLDHTPPSVSITSPSGGAAVKGLVTIVATASDNTGVVGVQFQVDGVNLGPAATTAPYSVVWDASLATGGVHTLTAIANDAVGNATASAPVSVVVGAPGGAFSASALIYAPQLVNTSSVARSVTLTSTGTESLSISGFTVTGDFSQTNNCAGSLPPNAVCTVKVTFSPTARGKRTGTLVLNSNISGQAPSISLTGTGFGPAAAVSPASLTFAAREVNTASPPKSVTLSNTGESTLHIQSISASGDFTQSNNCGTKINAGGKCTINVTFKPTAYGNRTGTLTFADDASGGSQTVSLSGTGVDYSISASPAGATVTAGKPATYTVTAAALGGTFGSAVSLRCSNLPAASSCSFSPASLTPGNTSANSRLTISTTARAAHNGTPAGTYTVTITGTSGATKHSTTVNLTVK